MLVEGERREVGAGEAERVRLRQRIERDQEIMMLGAAWQQPAAPVAPPVGIGCFSYATVCPIRPPSQTVAVARMVDKHDRVCAQGSLPTLPAPAALTRLR